MVESVLFASDLVLCPWAFCHEGVRICCNLLITGAVQEPPVTVAWAHALSQQGILQILFSQESYAPLTIRARRISVMSSRVIEHPRPQADKD